MVFDLWYSTVFPLHLVHFAYGLAFVQVITVFALFKCEMQPDICSDLLMPSARAEGIRRESCENNGVKAQGSGIQRKGPHIYFGFNESILAFSKESSNQNLLLLFYPALLTT